MGSEERFHKNHACLRAPFIVKDRYVAPRFQLSPAKSSAAFIKLEFILNPT
jgi:hypothetical protein